MAIDRIPGIGPANSDIASATAAVVPTTAQIAAAVPTIAAITTAITTNAAPAATTVAAITSAGNSAGWGTTGGPTWTALSTTTIPSSGTTVSLTGFGSYKTYKLVWTDVRLNSNAGLGIKINSVSTGYNYGIHSFTGTTLYPPIVYFGLSSAYFYNINGAYSMGEVIFEQANLTGAKNYIANIFTVESGGSAPVRIFSTGGTKDSTAPITALQLVTNSAFLSGAVTLYGGN